MLHPTGRGYTLSDFDFALPTERIAQHPSPQRSGSRLLDGTGAAPSDRMIGDLPSLLRAGDLLILNDTKVMKARLFGTKPSGGKLELLIERVLSGNEVLAHMRVSKKPAAGSVLAMTGAPGIHDGFRATLLGRWPDAQGNLFRLLLANDAGDDPYTLMERHGHVPLPPYITHSDDADDAARYQTVFAKHLGAVAAPTAALHFDEALLAAIDAAGAQRAYVTLHVGAGTFQPIKSENLSEHQMHSEWYEVPVATQQAIAACRARGGRIVAVGTTSVRALESWARESAVRSESTEPLRDSRNSDLTPLLPASFRADTKLFITPGFEFELVDLLLTNFHLPKSSLLLLVSALAGYEHIMALYRHAIVGNYRFFSYGDAMLLSRNQNHHAAI